MTSITYHALYPTNSVTKRFVLKDRTHAAIPTGRPANKLPITSPKYVIRSGEYWQANALSMPPRTVW